MTKSTIKALLVYSGAFIVDYVLFRLIEWLLMESITKYQVVAMAFENAKIGLALLLIFFAVIHGILSTIAQLRLDYDVQKRT